MAALKTSDYTVKLMMIGDSGVGKTALMVRFSDGGFQSEMAPTIGVDFKIKYMETTDGKRVKVQLWDTAGQERFRTITTHYYRGANGVMVVFDLSSRQTFQEITGWIKNILQLGDRDVYFILVGNKNDLERQVQRSEAESLAEKYNARYFEMSAKTGDGVTEAFMHLAETAAARVMRNQSLTKNDSVQLAGGNAKDAAKKNKCCA